ncbi:MAG: hypothetical protein ACR2IP_02490 [Solirubrobacteraceae bacterium]
MKPFPRRTRLLILTTAVSASALAAALLPAAAAAGTFGVSWSCLADGGSAGIFTRSSNGGYATPLCNASASASTASLEIDTPRSRASAGQYGRWATSAPAGLAIVGASLANALSSGVNTGLGWGGGFFWGGGGAPVNQTKSSYGFSFAPSSYWGFQIVCGGSCNPGKATAYFAVGEVTLVAQENSGPSVTADGANNLYYHSRGWVRGSWPISFSTHDVSGVCGTQAIVNGQGLPGPSASPNPTVWHQCPDLTDNQGVNTAAYGDGQGSLVLSARNAAGVVSSPSTAIYIDNQTPTVALAGARDVPSSTGSAQSVSATAAAGPSGVQGILCSVDGASPQGFPSAAAQVPVSGLGQHSIGCLSASNSVDVNGTPATSAPATTTLSIRQPTAVGISFGSQTLDAERCHRGIERITVPGKLVTVRHHGKRIKVRRKRTKTLHVVRCHPRIVYVGRRGHKVRRVLLPHTSLRTKMTVPYGHSSTVSGWVGTFTGVALGGERVSIMTAPDNGSHAFTPAATATAAADGSWHARLPAGPSRLVQAAYGGSGISEPSASGQVRVVVPAHIRLLSISPRQVPWGGTVHIVGQLDGGYLPPAGALVRLRIGAGGGNTTYGVQTHVTGTGRFATSYTFGAGSPSTQQRFGFQIATLPQGDYPFAPANSGRVSVVVGGHPVVAPVHHPPKHRAAHKHRRGHK